MYIQYTMQTNFLSFGFQWQGNTRVADHTFYEQKYDFVNNDEACMNACRFMERCKGFEKRYEPVRRIETWWGEFSGDMCWFKEFVEDAEPTDDDAYLFVRNGTIVSFMDDLKATEAVFAPDYDFHPNMVADHDEFTMGDVVYGTSQHCADLCTNAYPGCVGFVTDPINIRCWLKSEMVPLTESIPENDHTISHVYTKKF